MNMLQSHPKITPRHLQRKAMVYLRQSSERQVQRHTESQRLQYDLAARARALGFAQVEIIDTDLGHSAAIGAARREGFERFAQFILDCSSAKWSKDVTNSPFLARLATAGSNAAYKIISACSNAVS
jgi:hypothetical protein